MLFGVQMFATHYAIRPDDLAREAEARRFESIWLPEHTHIPTSRRSPWPGGPVLPKEYWHTYDLFVALSMAAAVTTTHQGGLGHLSAGRARSDHHREGGRVARPSLRRPRALRHRRRLERGGDGEPRHRVPHSLEAAEGARAGDEGDLDRGRGQLRGRVRATSSRSGPGPSRCSARIRRSSWGRTVRRRWRAWSTTATAGSRSACARAICSKTSPTLAPDSHASGGGTPTASPSTSTARPPSRDTLAQLRDAGVTRAVFGCRRPVRRRCCRCSIATPTVAALASCVAYRGDPPGGRVALRDVPRGGLGRAGRRPVAVPRVGVAGRARGDGRGRRRHRLAAAAPDALGRRAAGRRLPALREGAQPGRVRLRPRLGHGRAPRAHPVLSEAARGGAVHAGHRAALPRGARHARPGRGGARRGARASLCTSRASRRCT